MAGKIDQYDDETGVYLKTLESDEQSSGWGSKKSGRTIISNLGIYQPESNRSTLFFDDKVVRNITHVLFESSWKEGKVQFNGCGENYDYEYSSAHIKHNSVVNQRPLRDRLLVTTYLPDKDVHEIWLSKKNGSERQCITTFTLPTTWHLDVKNMKVRLVMASDKGLEVVNYDW